MAPVFAIELDDWSHNSLRARKRYMFVNNLHGTIGLPLLRLPVRESGALEALVEKLSTAWFRGLEFMEIR